MDHSHFFSAKEWNRFIDQKRFQIVKSVTPDILLGLNNHRYLCLQTAKDSSNIPYDTHQWSHSQKGSIPRHQPAYKKMTIQGLVTHAIRCTDVVNPDFKKDILHLDNATYHHYFLTGNGQYEAPDEKDIKKPRISDDTAEQVRDLLKSEYTARQVFQLAQSRGLDVSQRQCHNQLRNIRDTSDSEAREKMSKKKREITMEQLQQLKEIFPNDVSISTDSSNQVHYHVKINVSGVLEQNPQDEFMNQFDYGMGYDPFLVKNEPLDTGMDLPALDFPILEYPKLEYE